MATTEIKAFTTNASGAGGNRLTPAAYAALTTLLANGFQAGVALSVQVNTVLAQTSFVCAGLANWMVGQGVSVPDDGNLTNFVTELTTALTTFLASTTSAFPVVAAGGTADAITATYSPAIALVDKQIAVFVATAANATTTPTFAPNGLTAHTIVKKGGQALVPGDIPGALAVCILEYNLANTRWELVDPASSSTNIASGVYKNLIIKNNATTPTTKADVTADSASMEDTSHNVVRANAVSVTINMATTGANALDTGALANNTWYNIWLISNGTTVAGLASLSATAPTMPGGYIYKARFGAMRTNGSAQLLGTKQAGNQVQYTIGGTNISGMSVLTMASGSAGSTTTPTWVAVATGNFVPPTASKIKFVGSQFTSNTSLIVAPNNTAGPYSSATNPSPYVSAGGVSSSQDVPQGEFILESTNIYWACTDSSGILACLGWTDNI